MDFYPYNIFSLAPLAIAYGVLALFFGAMVWGSRGWQGRSLALSVVGAIFIALPVSEELWIAWNFGQACKNAGVFVHRKVQVEGFYDDTSPWGAWRLAESKYQFVESKDQLRRAMMRAEFADDATRDDALKWASEDARAQLPTKSKFITRVISDTEQIVVSPSLRQAWKVTRIDQPTARYHYRYPHAHTHVSHGIVKLEWAVSDTSGEEIARKTAFSRGPSWFLVGLDAPKHFCSVFGKYGENLGAPLYSVVLEPKIK